MSNNTVNETFQAMNDAARRTSERTFQAAQDVTETTRQTIEETSRASRQVFDTWTQSSETAVRATFDLQNAAIAAGISLVAASNNSIGTVLNQWASVVRQAQQSTLQAWEANVRQAQNVGEKFNPGQAQGR